MKLELDAMDMANDQHGWTAACERYRGQAERRRQYHYRLQTNTRPIFPQSQRATTAAGQSTTGAGRSPGEECHRTCQPSSTAGAAYAASYYFVGRYPLALKQRDSKAGKRTRLLHLITVCRVNLGWSLTRSILVPKLLILPIRQIREFDVPRMLHRSRITGIVLPTVVQQQKYGCADRY